MHNLIKKKLNLFHREKGFSVAGTYLSVAIAIYYTMNNKKQASVIFSRKACFVSMWLHHLHLPLQLLKIRLTPLANNSFFHNCRQNQMSFREVTRKRLRMNLNQRRRCLLRFHPCSGLSTYWLSSPGSQ